MELDRRQTERRSDDTGLPKPWMDRRSIRSRRADDLEDLSPREREEILQRLLDESQSEA